MNFQTQVLAETKTRFFVGVFENLNGVTAMKKFREIVRGKYGDKLAEEMEMKEFETTEKTNNPLQGVQA